MRFAKVLVPVVVAAALMVVMNPVAARSKTHGKVPGAQLTSEQRQQTAEIREDTRLEVRRIQRDANLSRQERADRIRQAQIEGHERVMSILTPEQRRDFNERWMRRQGRVGPGARVGAGPGVRGREPLGADIGQGVPGVQLTEDQKRRIAAIREDTRQEIQDIRRDPDLSQEQKAERITDVRREAHDRALDVLTREQRRDFQDWWDRRHRQDTAPGMRRGMGPGARGQGKGM